jgi:flap endonuclease-1
MGIKDFFRVTDKDGTTIKDMGQKFKKSELNALEGLRVVIDTPAILHAAVRGMPNIQTMTHNGKVTSHLNVIFFNVLQWERLGIDQLWVFDGKAPTIKSKELDKRKQARKKAEKDKKKAKGEKIQKLEKIAYQLEDYIYTDTKRLLTRMGISWIVAPEEGEAYCSYLTKKGDYDFVLSMDADCFMFGAKQIIRPTKEGKDKVFYLYNRNEIMSQLEINNDELLDVGICLGTDFSEKIRGVGPKTVIKKVKAGDLEFTKEQVHAKKYFKTAPTKGAQFKKGKFNKNQLRKFLEKRGFDLARIMSHIEDLQRIKNDQ